MELTGEKHSKNDERQTREDALVELYIVETIEKLRNLYTALALLCAVMSVAIISWGVSYWESVGLIILDLGVGLAFAYGSYLLFIKAIGEHYFKRRFKNCFQTLLDHLDEPQSFELDEKKQASNEINSSRP